ncbi:hypothetical protein MmTuc01_1749 [Methanosarcina mazei Tuc01]|uniref:Uncharacterized protein n=1 Tax=Methanosarcina mazei Tuc01 TaxID=1236903 RepID=M1P9E4_METMZ|nr:hypothetical protein MmTuc01_1749 [Methanosarcina mazei Tuc01]
MDEEANHKNSDEQRVMLFTISGVNIKTNSKNGCSIKKT